MAVTVIQPNNGGGLAQAVQLWSQFFGPQSQQNAATLEATKQGTRNAAQQFDINAELRAPNVSTAQSSSQIHAAEASKAMDDEADRKGAIAAYASLPADLASTPTTDMGEKYPIWLQAQRDNGVKNIANAAKAHNNTTATAFGNVSSPKGAITSGYNSAGGDIQEAGSVFKPSQLPDLSSVLGAPAPSALGPTPGAAAAPPAGLPSAPAVAPPSVMPPGAPTAPGAFAAPPAASSALPNIPLAALANPFVRSLLETQNKIQGETLANREKQQGIEKGARDVAFGTPEERKSESEFVRNAAQLSHRLDEYKAVVGGPYTEKDGTAHPEGFGNYEYWNGEGAANLKSLPLDISDNWTKITNPGGVLREGLVNLGKELQIPTANDNTFGKFYGPRNATTLAAIDKTKKVLADYVRQYENMASTKTPVAGLTPELRGLVGETKFGKPGDIPTEAGAKSPQSYPVVGSPQEAIKSVALGQTYRTPDPTSKTGFRYLERGKEPWAQASAAPGLPPIALPLPTQIPSTLR